jgi:hypothetical protein
MTLSAPVTLMKLKRLVPQVLSQTLQCGKTRVSQVCCVGLSCYCGTLAGTGTGMALALAPGPIFRQSATGAERLFLFVDTLVPSFPSDMNL